ncbi:hypothetical protein Dda_5761 [Drechslerella dactyloides]|uniref:F-box domain-containing protein n=1 Tax=Drechslerella dactyloides TaxID=74499 RepID=A0AAD6NGM0_DREDA|nr:hypothetical protein Dda_5761 [Drechslerella dactyloides]
MATDCDTRSLTALPAELLLAILGHLPSKPALRGLALTNRKLRAICMPYLFDSISVKSVAALHHLVDSGVAETVGVYVKRLVLRWDSIGAIVTVEQQHEQQPHDDVFAAVATLAGYMPGLKAITADFPGAFTTVDKMLEKNGHATLQSVAVRNGKWELADPIDGLVQRLAALPALKSLTLDGVTSRADTAVRKHAELPVGAFASLDKLELASLSTLDDALLRSIVASTRTLRTLSVRSCTAITLANTRALLAAYGHNLHHLSLDIIKSRLHTAYNPTDRDADADGEGSRHELMDISPTEHLCPAIRRCVNLRTLDLYTNKICSELFHPPTTSASTLPTPPGSPTLLPIRVPDIPTPPSDANAASDTRGISGIPLPPPSFSLPATPTLEDEKQREEIPATVRTREKMTRVALRIPYDASCFGAGAGGPSVQQRYTRLCDGLPAGELLEIGKRAFEEGVVGVVSVRGHWKGGPYLIMD